MLLVTIKRKTRLMTNDALLDGEYSMDSGKLDQTWADICAQIKSYNNIDPSQINAFFSRLQPQAMSEGFLMLTADNDFIKTWIERHYVDFIKQALLDLFHIPFTVVIEVDITTAANSASREEEAVLASDLNPTANLPSRQAPAPATAGQRPKPRADYQPRRVFIPAPLL